MEVVRTADSQRRTKPHPPVPRCFPLKAGSFGWVRHFNRELGFNFTPTARLLEPDTAGAFGFPVLYVAIELDGNGR